MPSAIPAKLPKQSSTTTSQSGDPGGYSNTIMASDAGPVIAAIENKIRNLEKRKVSVSQFRSFYFFSDLLVFRPSWYESKKISRKAKK